MNLQELKDAWELLGDIPVDENDCTEEEFSIHINGKEVSWPAGTDKFAIWHWFDEKCPNNLAEDLMFAQTT